jgi:predicted DNA-binding transcriptional regulator AlpA
MTSNDKNLVINNQEEQSIHMTITAVVIATTLSRATLYRISKTSEFPDLKVLTRKKNGEPSRTGFLRKDIEAWANNRPSVTY